MYKSKAKKMQPINKANGINDPLKGKDNWYECLKAQDTPQQQVGEYEHLLLLWFLAIPYEIWLTLKRLTSLDVGNMLFPKERVLFNEMMLNWKGVISFE